VRRRVGRALDQRFDDVRRCRQVGVADPEADHVHAGGATFGDLALDAGK
jgi:hypothetical protein